MFPDRILSYVESAKTANLIFSLLESYGRKRKIMLPTSFLVQALGEFGHKAGNVRQALYRMALEGDVISKRKGRNSFIALSKLGETLTGTGTSKMVSPLATAWDGKWTMIAYSFAQEERDLRNQVKSVLDVQGFAPLSRGLYIHPQDRIDHLKAAFSDIGAMDSIHLFRGNRLAHDSNRSFAMKLWDLETINNGYEKFVADFECYTKKSKIAEMSLSECVAVRFTFVLQYLKTAWQDPELPMSLLPRKWNAARAQRVAVKLHSLLDKPLMKYCDTIIQQLSLERVDHEFS